MLIKRTITDPNTAATGANENNAEKKVIFKKFAPFTKCLSKINNTRKNDTSKQCKEIKFMILM